MKVPFVDLKSQYRDLAVEIQSAISLVLEKTAFIRGEFVERFETDFASYCKLKHCLGVGNGTDALVIALKAVGIGPGDEVIVPANSFVATSEAVTNAGGRIVFADVDPQRYTIDVLDIRRKITPKTKAIIPVHLYGQPADMAAIRCLADEYSLKIVQDCAQAHGATENGKTLGEYGDVLCFSFYPGKNLGAYGDAGAILTDDDDIIHFARMYANHGRISKYDHEFEGVNSRMDGLQGAILSVKLPYLNKWTSQRRSIAQQYDYLLSGIDGITSPSAAAETLHVYHLYVVRCSARDVLKTFLSENGISTGIHYPIALPNLQAYRYLGHSASDFPVSSRLQQEILSLPIYPEMESDMVEYVVDCIRRSL